MEKIKYKRVLIKISGGAMGSEKETLDYNAVDAVAAQLAAVSAVGVQVAVVVGGGNIFRGRASNDMDRNIADNMGMLATAINSLALQDALQRQGVKCIVMSAIEMYQVCESFAQRHCDKLLEEGYVVVFACGTGNPYFSTDTAAALRAAQIDADVLMLAKAVDGIYDKDPHNHSDAKKFDELTYDEVISRGLQATDLTAITLCKERRLPIMAFGLNGSNNIIRVVRGENIGTLIRG